MGKGEVKYRITADAKPFTDAFGQAEKVGKQFTDSMVGATGSLGKIAAAAGPAGIAVAAVAGALAITGGAVATFLANAAKGAVELGGHLSDTAAKTGISTTALQKLGAAAQLTGGTMDSASGAVVKLTKQLTSAPEGFAQLGLSVDKLRKMEPDQLLLAVSDKLRQLPAGFQQSAAGLAVLGKGAAEYLPFLLSQVREAGDRFENLGGVIKGSTVSALDALGDEITVAGQAWQGFENQLGAAIAQSPELQALVTDFTGALGDLAQWVAQHQGEITGFIDKLAMKAQALLGFLKTTAAFVGIDTIGGGGGYLSSSSRLVLPKGPTFDPDASRVAAAAAAARKKQEQEEQTHLKFLERIRHDSAMLNLREDEDFWKRQVQLADDYGRKLLEKILKEQADAAKAKQGHAFITEYALQQEAAQLDKSAAKWQVYGDAIATVAGQIGGTLGGGLKGLGGIFDGLAAHQQQAAQNLVNYGDKAMTTAQKLQAAAQAAAGAIAIYQQGYQSKSVGKGALMGATQGAGQGAQFGPIGAGVGAVVGLGLGIFGAKKGQAAELKELRAEFDSLVRAAAHAGIAFDHAFDTRTAKGLKAAIDEIKRALDLQDESQQKLNEAVERYGFTIDELGPTFAKQKLDEQMAQIYQDWQLLTAAGVDHEAMLNRIGPEVGKLVDQYVSAGVEVPASMKPIIDDLYTHHKLVHENGEEYTEAEYKGITYAQTMSQMFTDLIKHVQDLVDAINGMVLHDKNFNINGHYRPDPNVPPGGGYDDGGDGGRKDREGGPRDRGYATGGVFEPRAGGHVIRVAEGGQAEAVLNPQQMLAMMGGSPEALAELRQMNANLRRMPQAIAIAARDAYMVGR